MTRPPFPPPWSALDGSQTKRQAPIVKTIFRRRFLYCSVEADARLVERATNAMNTQGCDRFVKGAFRHRELAVSNNQSPVSRFEVSNSRNHIRTICITFLARIGIGGLASGEYPQNVIRNGNLRNVTLSVASLRTRKGDRFEDENEPVLLDCGETPSDNFLQIELSL